MPVLEDLTGQRFGRLVVLRRGSNLGRSTTWRCVCDCGEQKEVRSHSMKVGDAASCGCLLSEVARVKAKRLFTKHGGSARNEYKIWKVMRGRCTNKKVADYENYGGRGIAVCARWSDFECFLADMGERPSLQHSIERRDNEKGYNPENCYWATREEQNRNKRTTVKYTFLGETLTQAEWCRRLGITSETLRYRLKNWPQEKVFTEPRRAWPT